MLPHTHNGYGYTIMSEHTAAEDKGKKAEGGVSRRRLMRAGLSAAPVVLALKSNSVLATGTGGGYCVKPSTFASLGAAAIKSPNASQAPRVNTGYKCYSQGYWKQNNTGLSPSDFKTKTGFLSSTTGFVNNPGSTYTNKTIQQVLEMSGGDHIALARHIAAAYLTARVYPTVAVLSVSDCKAIWNSGGNWSPVAGDNSWNQAKWLDYFKLILG